MAIERSNFAGGSSDSDNGALGGADTGLLNTLGADLQIIGYASPENGAPDQSGVTFTDPSAGSRDSGDPIAPSISAGAGSADPGSIAPASLFALSMPGQFDPGSATIAGVAPAAASNAGDGAQPFVSAGNPGPQPGSVRAFDQPVSGTASSDAGLPVAIGHEELGPVLTPPMLIGDEPPPDDIYGPSTVVSDQPGAGSGASDPANPASGGQTTFQVTVPGSGMVFNNTITSDSLGNLQTYITEAEDIIAQHWTNSITLNINFQASPLGQNGTLASNSFYVDDVSYAQLKSALASHDGGSIYAQDAVAALPANNPAAGNALWALPVSYARMLGFSPGSTPFDDSVTLNTSYNWTSAQAIIDTLMHEMSEGAMGRIGGLGDQNSFWSTMDLFRYNASGHPDYTDGRDGAATYFSYNGGATLSSSAGLSFNNEFNSSGQQVNGGDTADFNELDVFGTGSPSENFGLSQTDIQIMDALGWDPQPASPPPPPPPPPTTPAGTTADIVLRDTGANSGQLQIVDIGNNTILATSLLGNVGLNWQVMGFGDFAGDPNEADMIMHDSNTGALQYFDIRSSQIISAGSMGSIGAEWQPLGVGDFSGNANETDMIIRNTNNGSLYYFDIQHNQIVSAGSMGNIGTEWQALGVGDFSGIAGEADIIIRNPGNGSLYCFDIQHNQIVSAGSMGNIGTEWQPLGVGDFSGNANETDMIMRNTSTGALYYFDIQHNQIVSAGSMGNIGVNWQAVGFGDVSSNPGESDMIMRDSNTGNFEYFDIQHNQIVSAGSLGGVTTSWHVVGLGSPLMLGSPLV